MGTPQNREQSATRTQISEAYDDVEKEIENLQAQLKSQNRILSPKIQWRLSAQLDNDSPDREAFLQNLQQKFLRINALVSEANRISNEMQQLATFKTILQIPVSYLKANERTLNNLCEPAVQMKERTSAGSQTWSCEKFEGKLNDVKEIYDRWMLAENKGEFLSKELKRNNPFSAAQSNRLIGVGNIHLKALFYNAKLDYTVPIINTQGQVRGSLHVVLNQTGPSSMKKLTDFQINSMARSGVERETSIDHDELSLSNSEHSLEDEGIDTSSALSFGDNEQLTVKFSIKEARGLPPCAAEHVMCRYTFINPKLDQTVISSSSTADNVFTFDHENEYTFPINEEFLSTCFESSISIEVWYQSSVKKQAVDQETSDRHASKVRELGELWKDVRRHIKFSVAIQELDELGQWTPVDVHAQEQIVCGGVYRLKQGQSRRILTELRVLPRSNPMPLVLDMIRSVEIGSISARKVKAPRQLDSYQDVDLQELREQWLEVIENQKTHVESQVKQLNEQENKTPYDLHRESVLLEQLFSLAEERNIVEVTPTSSGIPGSPTVWNNPPAIEKHRPLILLNIDPVRQRALNPIGGVHAVLSEEDQTKMFPLPLIHVASNEIHAVALWDPTIHESTFLNRVTSNDTLIYLIVKIVVLISQPVPMEMVLRKRIAVTINKTGGWLSGKLVKNFLGEETYHRTGVVYEVVSHIPEHIRRTVDEDQSGSTDLSQEDLKKFLPSASLIDSLLLLDKLRLETLLATQKTTPRTPKKRTTVHTTSSALSTALNVSTPSMNSRSSFIEEQFKDSRPTSSFQIKHIIDLETGDPQRRDEGELREKYAIDRPQRQDEHELRETHEIDENFAIASRVLVNTGHTIFNKVGVIRYIGSIATGKGTWYGIELDEPVGKNNGSVDDKIYFTCSENRGIFVRRDKIQSLIN